MSTVDFLEELLQDELKDIYDAEKQLTKALPKMIKHATADDLKQAFQDHARQTEQRPRPPRGGGSEETLGPQVYFPGACRSALMNGSAAAGITHAWPASTVCGLTSLPYRSWLSSLSGRTTPPDRFTPANRPCVRE